jgi:transcription initiation factor IIE alpha subunit
MAKYFWCKHCGDLWPVSVEAQYAEDNYTCPKCGSELRRNVKMAQPTANRVERTTK